MGHFLQAPELPGFSANSPGPQAVQLKSAVASWVVPGMQATHREAPVATFVSRPRGHMVHELAAYIEGRKRRAGHGLQPLAPVPSAAAPLTALVSVIWPAGQALQTFWPVVAAK